MRAVTFAAAHFLDRSHLHDWPATCSAGPHDLVPYSFLFALLALGSLSTACESKAINRYYDDKIADVRTQTNRAFVFTSCDGGGVGARCGLILKHAATASFRETFREKKCVGKSDGDCQTALNRFIDAQLTARYFAADWDAVTRTCDMRTPRCDDGVQYELLLVDSHNQWVRAEQAEKLDALRTEKAQAQAAHRERVTAIAVGVVNEVQCATYKGPKCRSYPSIHTGQTLTMCE